MMEETERVRLVNALGIMGTRPDPEFDRFARLAGHVAEASYAHVCFIDDTIQYAKAMDGLSFPKVTPREQSICVNVVETRKPVLIEDLAVDPRPYIRDIHRRHGVSTYVGVPIRWAGGQVVGAVAALASDNKTLSTRRLAALEECSSLVTRELLIRKAAGSQASRAAGSAAGQAATRADVLKSVTKNHLAVLRAVSDGVFLLREDGSINFVNAAAEQILGRLASSLIGSKFAVSVSVSAEGMPVPESECPVSACLRDGAERLARTALFLRSDNQAVCVEYVVSPIIGSDRPIGAVVVFRRLTKGNLSNGTEFRHTLREVYKLKEQIARLEALRIAPELRTPELLPDLGSKAVDFFDLLQILQDERASQFARAKTLCDGRVEGVGGAAALLGGDSTAPRRESGEDSGRSGKVSRIGRWLDAAAG